MINISSITAAIFTIIASDSVLVSSDTNVVKYGIIDTSPNASPFVNVKRPSYEVSPWRANIGQPYKALLSCPIYCHVLHTQNDEQAQEEIDLLTDGIMTAINSGTSRTLKDTVNIILGYNVEPIDLVNETNDYIYANEITLIAEVFA